MSDPSLSSVWDCKIDTVADEALLEPYTYLTSTNGKGIRQALMEAFNVWLKVPDETLAIISDVIQMLHNASLIIDDIEDGSSLRRGRPSAHCIFGVPLSINAANYVYFLALQKLAKLNNPKAMEIFAEQMLILHHGQGLDIFWRCHFKCPTEAEYRTMVVCKTGGLFGLAVRLMQLFSNDEKDYRPLLNALGLLFQIRDDYANLTDTSYFKAKTFADDLTEGKFSFPVVHAIQTHPTDNQVMSVLCQRTTNYAVKRQCIRHMIELGSLDHTVRVLDALENRCKELISEYGDNPLLSKFIQHLNNVYRSSDGSLHFLKLDEFDQILPLSEPASELPSTCPVPPCFNPMHNNINNHKNNNTTNYLH